MKEINLVDSKILLSDNISNDLAELLKKQNNVQIFVLIDENTKNHCLPIIKESFNVSPKIIEIKSGEEQKNIDTAMDIWNFLSSNGCDRKSLLINLGGGIITDIGGFVASSFKRGINFINIPTTLLAQVDASIGGKTGINFNNLKNEVGFFNSPQYTIIDTKFLKTLEKRQIISGFAEMLKHSIISSEENWEKIKNVNLKNIDYKYLSILVEESIKIKKYFVENDPFENNLRENLNFGHTFGHAIETFYIDKGSDILHGEAVAMGIICELFLSNKIKKFDLKKMLDVIGLIIDNFPYYEIKPSDYEAIIEIMKHDKKNKENKIRFTLISDFGKTDIGQSVVKDDIIQTLAFYFQIMR